MATPYIAAMSTPADNALATIKAYVRDVASAETIDQAALFLTGLPEDKLNAGLVNTARTMADNLARLGRGSHIQTSLGYAFAEVVRERVAEFEATGRGRA